MLPKWVYTAMVEVPTSLARRRRVRAARPSVATICAAVSINASLIGGISGARTHA